MTRHLKFAISLTTLLTGLHAASGAQTPLPPDRPVPRPILSIGETGEPESEFTQIGFALRTPSGSIAIVDFGATGIRLFGPDGKFQRNLGRNGAGPGEFRRIGKLFLVGDTLVAYDAVLRRITIYLVDGRLVRTMPFQYPPEYGSLGVIGRQRNGNWIVATAGHSPSWNNGSGVYRDTSRVGILPASLSGPIRWLDSVPGMTFFVHMPAERRSEWQVGGLPFSPYPIIAAWQDSAVVGDLASTELRYYSSSGQVARRLQLPRLTAATNLAEARALELPSMRTAADSAYVNQSYAAAEKARDRRVWERLVIADDGALWLAVADPRPNAASRYLVVAPNGRALAAWLLPARSRLLSVKGNELLVGTRDDDDVERVVVIRL